jgi:hypothetical protein
VQTVQPGLEDLHPHSSGGGESDDHHEDAPHNNSSPVQKKRSMLGFFKKRSKDSKDKEGGKHHTDKDKEKETSDHDKFPPPPPSSSSSGRPGLFRSHSDIGASSHKKGGVGGKESSDGKSFSPPGSPSQHGHKTPEKSVGFAISTSPPSYHSHTAANNGYNGRKPTTPRRKSEKEIKTEASLLRQQIATTEYELERLAKNIRKKMIAGSEVAAASNANNTNTTNTTSSAVPPPSASKSGGDKRLVTPAEYNALQEQQQELQTKLVNLKKQHVELTGITYEQARRERSTFSRLRSLGSSTKKLPQQNQSYSNTLPMAMATPNNNLQELMGMPEATAEPMSNQSSPAREQMINNFMFKDPSRNFPRPLHWLSYQ